MVVLWWRTGYRLWIVNVPFDVVGGVVFEGGVYGGEGASIVR